MLFSAFLSTDELLTLYCFIFLCIVRRNNNLHLDATNNSGKKRKPWTFFSRLFSANNASRADRSHDASFYAPADEFYDDSNNSNEEFDDEFDNQNSTKRNTKPDLRSKNNNKSNKQPNNNNTNHRSSKGAPSKQQRSGKSVFTKLIVVLACFVAACFALVHFKLISLSMLKCKLTFTL